MHNVSSPLNTRFGVRQEELFWRERQEKLKMLADFDFTKSCPPSGPRDAAEFPPKQGMLHSQDVNRHPQVSPSFA